MNISSVEADQARRCSGRFVTFPLKTRRNDAYLRALKKNAVAQEPDPMRTKPAQ
jgi:hypothetical protein